MPIKDGLLETFEEAKQDAVHSACLSTINLVSERFAELSVSDFALWLAYMHHSLARGLVTVHYIPKDDES